ncbi:DUF1501 domain-containing protein [Dyadobacter pollutisoli]|uniref:DUF1501 domain-containing protein n=1 Tax=Dyadobacter pollutisoli TaxID=2910158 RepID=A0A9E8NDQ6_9BACT|nr:DUF1501 domain-containing protein [Dyadobacter pollutisoli]WAC13116.1 DUF1501 domain-containing protein [Dyadobacter pollutisoli]
MITRRGFIKAGGLALFGIGSGGIPAFLANAVAAGKSPGLFRRKKVLICIFQRGAMDGLMAVAPFTDPYLKAARPTLFMTAAKTSDNPLIDLDGRFGLHPSLHALEPMYRESRLAIVHGIGSPNPTRSHFDAQDYMESGTPFKKGTPSGWLNRAVGLLGHQAATPLQAVSLTSSLPRSLYGDNPAVAISNLQDFNIQLRGNQAGADMAAKSFENLYDQTSLDLLKQTGKETFEASKILQSRDLKNYKPANNAAYPAGALGNSLKQIAQLIKMNVGLEVAFAESVGWDTHFNQGTRNGIFARNLNDLSQSIAALWADLGTFQDDVMIMTMTEFGRTVHQNGTGGTDHGRASCNFILGNDVKGGLVYGKVAPLAPENLEDGRDLIVTTDFRSVFNEVATKHLEVSGSNVLFPEWNGNALNVMRN